MAAPVLAVTLAPIVPLEDRTTGGANGAEKERVTLVRAVDGLVGGAQGVVNADLPVVVVLACCHHASGVSVDSVR